MPKLKGEQLNLTMILSDRPRSEWVDMHCPLLCGAKVGDRIYAGEVVGTLQVSELSGALIVKPDDRDWPAPVFNRRLCKDAETKQLQLGDRVRYPGGEAQVYFSHRNDHSLGGIKYVWLPRDPNRSSYMPVPLPLVSNCIHQPLEGDRQNDAAPQAQQDDH